MSVLTSWIRIPMTIAVPLALAIAVFPSPGAAAPIARSADVTLQVSFPFIRDAGIQPFVGNPSTFHLQASGVAVGVDETAGSITLAAGALALTTTALLPVTGNTSVASLTANNLANASGRFSIGGAAGLVGEPACPPSQGRACVAQSGLGGEMGLAGTVFLHIVPDIVVISLDLAAMGLGLGGPLSSAGVGFSMLVDGAPWTIGAASVAAQGVTPTVLATTAGGISGSTLSLVSPAYIQNAFVVGLTPIFSRLEIEFTDGLGVPGFASDMVPEPSTQLLLGLALGLGLLASRRRP
ncbi:MAG: PEP-CTERM sorting domain-containing protein [Myxococcota bacterium]